MPLIAVASSRHAYGVESSSDDWRAPCGDDRNGREMRSGRVGVESRYEVQDLSNALEREYATDAHLVAYVLRDPRGCSSLRQPRINKQGLGFVRSLGFTVTIEVLFADVDNPAHGAWTPELLAIAAEQDRKLATAGVYYTSHGRRIVQPLTRAVLVEDAEGVLAGWLRSLQALGIHVDEGCQDWTRHFRCPHVRRQGKRFERSTSVDWSRMVPIDPPISTVLLGRRRRTRASIELSRPGDVADAPLAQAFDLAGWLGPMLGQGKRAVLCPFREHHTIGRDFDSSTVIFGATPAAPIGWWLCSHGHCSHRTQREAIAMLPAGARLLLDDAPRPERRDRPREIVSKERARPLLEEAFRSAPAGLSVVIASCGTGKTEAALAVAGERAEAEQRLDVRTAISVPTNRLAIEVAGRARAKGIAVRRIFGPLSVLRDDGSPECQIHECASAFGRGGLSVPWEFCSGRGKVPCEYATSCKASGGTEGPDDARVVIGPHALLSRLDAAAGKTGLLVIDEPPALLANEVLTPEQLTKCATDLLVYFEPRYAAALGVSLRALAGWIQTGPLDKPGPLANGVVNVNAELLELALDATGAENAIAAARAAFEESAEDEPRRRSEAPPVQRQYAFAARRAVYIARAIGEASRVARIVWTALTCQPGHVVARIEERKGHRVIVVTMPDVQLRIALGGINAKGGLGREGRTVVADAGGRQHLPIYRMISGADVPVTEVHAGDGAEVRRTHLRQRASRAGWMRHGQLVIDGSLVRSVELAVSWLLEEPTGKAALVTFKPLELALRAARGEGVLALWLKAGQDRETLKEAVRRLAGPLQRLPRAPDMGHYGAVRGLDHWREHDALVTLGDPWGQLGDARHEGDLLRIPDWEGRLEDAARGELEQAHGRLRTVHRSTPARALHVGLLRPGGWDGLEVDVRDDPGGRRRAADPHDVRAAVAREGSVSGAARALGVDRHTIRRQLIA